MGTAEFKVFTEFKWLCYLNSINTGRDAICVIFRLLKLVLYPCYFSVLHTDSRASCPEKIKWYSFAANHFLRGNNSLPEIWATAAFKKSTVCKRQRPFLCTSEFSKVKQSQSVRTLCALQFMLYSTSVKTLNGFQTWETMCVSLHWLK